MATFSGGAKLQMKLAELAAKVSKKGAVQVGFLEGSTYPDGTPVPMVAAIDEFGAPSRGQPPRPYFRNMIAAKSPDWGDQLGKQLKNADYDAEIALGLMGKGIEGQLQDSINQFTSPGLADSTIKKKGFDKPLVDTSHMVNSVNSEVIE